MFAMCQPEFRCRGCFGFSSAPRACELSLAQILVSSAVTASRWRQSKYWKTRRAPGSSSQPAHLHTFPRSIYTLQTESLIFLKNIFTCCRGEHANSGGFEPRTLLLSGRSANHCTLRFRPFLQSGPLFLYKMSYIWEEKFEKMHSLLFSLK